MALTKIDIAFIREHLHKLVAMSADIAEVHVEDLLAEAKVSNDVEDLLPRIPQHFRNRSLAKVQTVIRALLDRYELLQTIHRSQYAHNALVTVGRHSRIVRVASNSDLVFGGYRHHALEKIRNPLPGRVRVHMAGAR